MVDYNFETLCANFDAVLHASFLAEDGLASAIHPQHSDCLSLENQFVVWVLDQ